MKAELRALAAGPFIEKWRDRVGTEPFQIPARTFLANHYGAREDGRTSSTTAIQQAIDEAAAAGGGVVEFLPGTYVTGSLFLRTNVRLHLAEAVTLLGSENDEEWPWLFTRAAGIEMQWRAAMINVRQQENVEISGNGRVNARGKRWWDRFWNALPEAEKRGLRWAIDYDIARPHLIQIYESRNVIVSGITLQNSPFWTFDIVYSKNITVDGITVRNNLDGLGPSTDGINIDSSAFVVVQNCDVDCNDDCYSFKSGMNADGHRINLPAQYSIFRNSVARAGHGGITLGSDMSGGIRHVEASRIQCLGTDAGIRFKSARIRGGEVERVRFHDVSMENVDVAFQWVLNWFPQFSYPEIPEGITGIPDHWRVMTAKIPADQAIPHFHDIEIDGVRAIGTRVAFEVEAAPEKPLENIHLKNLEIRAQTSGGIRHARNWTAENVALVPADHQPVSLQDSSNVSLNEPVGHGRMERQPETSEQNR